MTAITEGMTPAEFISTLNDNFTEYWGTDGVAEILSTDGYVAAINTNFGEDTVAFGQSGLAFNNSLSKFSTFTHKLVETGTGASIDTSKFDVTNLDSATDVTFEQSRNITNKITGITTNEKWNSIIMNSLPSGVRVLMYRNQIRSVESLTHGAVRFCLANLFRVNNWIRVGLSDATNLNRIEISSYGANTLKYSIWEAGVEVYTTASGAVDFGQFQFVISPIGKISAWLLTNDAWVQIGTTQTYSLGSLKFYMSSEGAVTGWTSLTDVYITSRKFTTILPGVTNTARVAGEVPDGVTDNADNINAALVTGNVLLQNGVFAISESLKIPSNRTLTLRNAKIWMLNDSLDNFFRNSDFEGGNINGFIKGLGNGIFDGNAENNDDGYETYMTSSRAENIANFSWLNATDEWYHYFGWAFCNITNFEVSGLFIFNFPHEGNVMQHAKGGIFKNCHIMFKPLLAPANTSGFNILWGCENVDAYNILMLTDDDSCVLGANRPDFAGMQKGPARNIGMKNINMQDIEIFSTGGRGLITLISEGNKLENVHWSNIKIRICYYAFLVGYSDFAIIPAAKEDTNGIYIDNLIVDVNVNATVIKVNDKCKNIAITNFTNNSGKPNIAFEAGLVAADIENFTIEGVLQTP